MAEILRAGVAFDPSKHKVDGWFASEKLDGIRVFWDGGSTLGLPIKKVPWLSDEWRRLHREHLDKESVGLWTRYLNPVFVPATAVRDLPTGVMLDMEIWCGRQMFHQTSSLVRRFEVSLKEWEESSIGMWVHDLIPASVFFGDRKGQRNSVMQYDYGEWYRNQLKLSYANFAKHDMVFSRRLQALKAIDFDGKFVKLLDQTKVKSYSEAQILFSTIKQGRGEGLMLQNPNSLWIPKRVESLVKLKASFTLTGQVVGWTKGQGKHSDKMGALIIQPLANMDIPEAQRVTKNFSVGTGFDDLERALALTFEDPPTQYPRNYPIGCQVEIGYLDVTEDKCPREPRFLRKL